MLFSKSYITGQNQLIVAVILLGSESLHSNGVVWGSLEGANQEQNFITPALTPLLSIFISPIVKWLTGMQNLTLEWLEF
jgi:ACR3 family arsenite efflux pump ArsB